MYASKTDQRSAQRRSYSNLKDDPAWVEKKAAQNAASYQRRKKRNGDGPRLESARERRWRWGSREEFNEDLSDAFRVCSARHLLKPKFYVRRANGALVREGFQTAEQLEKKLLPLLKMRAPLLARMMRACA